MIDCCVRILSKKWSVVATAEEDSRSHATGRGGVTQEQQQSVAAVKIRKINIIKRKHRQFGLNIVLGPLKAVKRLIGKICECIDRHEDITFQIGQ